MLHLEAASGFVMGAAHDCVYVTMLVVLCASSTPPGCRFHSNICIHHVVGSGAGQGHRRHLENTHCKTNRCTQFTVKRQTNSQPPPQKACAKPANDCTATQHPQRERSKSSRPSTQHHLLRAVIGTRSSANRHGSGTCSLLCLLIARAGRALSSSGAPLLHLQVQQQG